LYPHPFRLHGPWDYEILSGAAAAPRGRLRLPCDGAWLPRPAFHGRVQFRRVFHRPTNLEPHERLWLACEAGARGSLSCNGRLLGGVDDRAPAEFEITSLLADSNELLMELELSPDPPGGAAGGQIGRVRLEVRRPQFLADWKLWLDLSGDEPVLRFEGRVGGEPLEESLELVIRTADQELLYAAVAAGSPISLSAPAGPLTAGRASLPLEVDVRLIHRGTRLWESRQSIGP
jgi:hypothetical protein